MSIHMPDALDSPHGGEPSAVASQSEETGGFKVRGSLQGNRHEGYQPWLFRFALIVLFVCCFLLYAGGFTTSIEAGMAFLDWPLSNGSINPEGWLTERDQLAEHSHRLIGMTVGSLCLALFLWCMLREQRAWVRRFSVLVLVMVVVQGLLGGLRVLLDEQNLDIDHNLYGLSFAVIHGCFGQIFFCALIGLTVALSSGWHNRRMGWSRPVDPSVRFWGAATCILLVVQLLLGAVMRHGRFSAIIPTFPAAKFDGSWIPDFVNWQTTLQFTHTRIGPILITIALIFFLVKFLRERNHIPLVRGMAWGGFVLLALQIALGILTVIKLINEHAATFHMLAGAFLLGNTFAMLFMAWHPVACGRPVRSSRDKQLEAVPQSA